MLKLIPAKAVVYISLFLILGLGVVDYLTPPRMSFTLFYLSVVTFAAWRAGRPAGLWVALASAMTLTTDEWITSSDRPHPWIGIWNCGVRLGVFVIVAFVVSATTRFSVALRKRVDQRTAELEKTNAELLRAKKSLEAQTEILKSICNSIGEGIVVADMQGNFILFTPHAEEMLGIGALSVPSEEWTKNYGIFYPDKITPFPNEQLPLIRALRREKSDDVEMFVCNSQRPDGVFLSVTGRPLVSKSGEHKGGVVVFQDITQRKQLEREILEISDREQGRIGQDLHDGLCQQLVSTAFVSNALEQKLNTQHLPEFAEAVKLGALLDDAITQARNIARGLYPVKLEAEGLMFALRELADNLNSRLDIRCELQCPDTVLVNDNAVATHLYRIAQEATNNAIKHSKAKQVLIELSRAHGKILLKISDDGIGIPNHHGTHGGMGLHIMNYRARVIGGSLDVQRGRVSGTVITCMLQRKT